MSGKKLFATNKHALKHVQNDICIDIGLQSQNFELSWNQEFGADHPKLYI